VAYEVSGRQGRDDDDVTAADDDDDDDDDGDDDDDKLEPSWTTPFRPSPKPHAQATLLTFVV
jgi:hypothetical protein